MAQSSTPGAEAAFPPLDPATFGSQLFWLVITFCLLYWMIAKLAIPQLRDILQTRNERIADDEDESRRLKEEAEEATKAYEQSLSEARRSAHELSLDARNKAQADVAKAQEKSDAKLAKKLQENEKRISEMRENAMTEVSGIATDTAGALVNSLIGTKPTKALLQKAVKAVEGATT